MEIQLENKIERLESKQVSFGERSKLLLKHRTRSIPVTFNFFHFSPKF